MKILETSRMVLRHLVLDDLDDLYALYSDPEVVRYIPDAPRSRDETRKELEWHMNGHPEDPRLGLWATILKTSKTLIGRCGLLPWSLDGRREIEVAFLIGRDHWGQGLATEAGQAICDHAFVELRLSRLVCLIEKGNIASTRVAEKIGMSFEKEGRDEIGPFLLYSMDAPPVGQP
jgi:RimJ/RimL family protein N-acetyltransferase